MNKNEFAKTPPMGWNSYDYYDTTVNEEQVKRNAEYMAKNLRKYGWEYIVVDIQWYAHGAGTQRNKFQYIPFSELEMDEYSRLLPDPERFPSSKDNNGFAPLAEYIHDLGLKFGIHIMRGIPRIAAHNHCKIKGLHNVTANDIANPSSICGWNPDMYGVINNENGQAYYDSLIELYASWGVDFIKCDDICNTNMYVQNFYSAKHEVEMLANAIKKSKRPIVLSLSPGPALIDKAWHYETYANMWRITDDFWDEWKLLKGMFKRCELWQNYVSAGCYPDCDMLPLGYLGKGFGHERTTNFTKDEQRTMMTLWCLFGSPLMIGAEMTKMDSWTLSLLTNEEVLKMHTPECRPRQICLDDKKAVWTGINEKTKDFYVAIFNLSDNEAEISVNIGDLNIDVLNINKDTSARAEMINLWEGSRIKLNNDGFINTEAALPGHGCAVYKLIV